MNNLLRKVKYSYYPIILIIIIFSHHNDPMWKTKIGVTQWNKEENMKNRTKKIHAYVYR